jgi:hypothetical protein
MRSEETHHASLLLPTEFTSSVDEGATVCSSKTTRDMSNLFFSSVAGGNILLANNRIDRHPGNVDYGDLDVQSIMASR